MIPINENGKRVFTVRLDEDGMILADCDVKNYIEQMFFKNKQDLHLANVIAINCLRSRLIKMPIEERPEIKWVFYGVEVHFDKDLRSFDAWEHPLTNLEESFLMDLLNG